MLFHIEKYREPLFSSKSNHKRSLPDLKGKDKNLQIRSFRLQATGFRVYSGGRFILTRQRGTNLHISPATSKIIALTMFGYSLFIAHKSYPFILREIELLLKSIKRQEKYSNIFIPHHLVC